MNILFSALVSICIVGLIDPVDDHKLVTSDVNQLSSIPDGPYVMYRNGLVHTRYVRETDGNAHIHEDSFALAEKSNIVLKVNTDIPGKTFSVRLKDQLENEKAEFPKAEKLLVISDIEGHFAAFRKLLQGNGVIDEEFNWTFGHGHLVLMGDFVDRGDLVTEVLWLVYSLEEKAKAAGGYVHYILGNHEIMNMSGDLRYLNKKYVDNAQLLNENFVKLFGEDSELGRWFRTKNVAEKIGTMLFVHGGISDRVNSMDISLKEINKMVRPFYADSTYKYPDPKLDTLYSDLGPFWYRGYYAGNAGDVLPRIDSTLDKFRVKHIATGHTIIADTVSIFFEGKLINTDVPHAKGFSEALLVDGRHFYRVNSLGEKFLLPGRRK